MIALVLLLQVEVTIPRTDKGDYPAMIKLCKEAQGLIDSDPRVAITKFDEILANTKIKHVEVRIRVEERVGDTTPWYDFLPRQYRGRARMNLAKAGGAEADKLLEGAVEDFSASVDAKVAASAALLETARAELTKVRGARARARWQRLIDEHRFKSAKAGLAAEKLTDEQRKELETETDARCAAWVNDAMVPFRKALAGTTSALTVESMGAEEFAGRFELPKADELSCPAPLLEWARALVAVLDAGRIAKKVDLDKLLAASVPPRADGDNPWIAAAETPAFGAVLSRAKTATDAARNADAETRQRLRADYDALVNAWSRFEQAFGSEVVERHPFVHKHGEELAALSSAFPIDLGDLDAIDIDAALASTTPAKALAAIEAKLVPIAVRKDLSRDSYRKLYSALVAVRALQRFLEGADEDAAAKELERYAAPLKAAGGAIDPDRHGPRVAKVFAKLTRE